jgi:hypothetical protein
MIAIVKLLEVQNSLKIVLRSDKVKTNLQPQKTDCCKTENAENELQEQRIQKTILTEPQNRMHKHHAMISLLN